MATIFLFLRGMQDIKNRIVLFVYRIIKEL